MVIRLRDTLRAERVGLDDVRTRFEILLVDFANHIRAREQQQLVVAFNVVRVVGETLAAVIRLPELVALDHGAHGTVEDENALL